MRVRTVDEWGVPATHWRGRTDGVLGGHRDEPQPPERDCAGCGEWVVTCECDAPHARETDR